MRRQRRQSADTHLCHGQTPMRWSLGEGMERLLIASRRRKREIVTSRSDFCPVVIDGLVML